MEEINIIIFLYIETLKKEKEKTNERRINKEENSNKKLKVVKSDVKERNRKRFFFCIYLIRFEKFAIQES